MLAEILHTGSPQANLGEEYLREIEGELSGERESEAERERKKKEREVKEICIQYQSRAEHHNPADVRVLGGYQTQGTTQHSCTRYFTHSWHDSRNISIMITPPRRKTGIKDPLCHPYLLKCHGVLIILKGTTHSP